MRQSKTRILPLTLALAMLVMLLPANLGLADGPDKQPTPEAVIDYLTERLTGLPAGTYIISIPPDADTSEIIVKDTGAKANTMGIDNGWFGKTISIVMKGIDPVQNSDPQELSIPARPERPPASLFTVTYASGGADGAIDGVTYGMEYRRQSDPAVPFTPVDPGATGLTLLSAGTYQIRYKAVATVDGVPGSFHSTARNVTVGTKSAEATPVIAINFANERLTGFTKNAAYLINGAEQTMAATWLAIDDAWMTGADITIVKKGNGTTTEDSDAQSFTIPARPAKPAAASFTVKDASYPDAADGEISGIGPGLECRGPGDDGFSPVTGSALTGLKAGEYIFRVAATDVSFRSRNTKVTLNAVPATPEAKPGASIDYAAEELTDLVAGAGYLIDGAPYDADSDGNLAIEGGWFGQTLSIVKKGNGTTTEDSEAQSLTVSARPAAPAGIGKTDETGIDLDDGAITGVTGAMEYKLSGASAWTACPAGSITGLAPGAYLVRYRATASAFASEAAPAEIGEFMPTYALSVTAPAFASVTDGYGPVAAKPIIIANIGNTQADIASVTLSDPARFILAGGGASVPKDGSISSWTIRPANNLPEGTYTALITVTYNGNKTATAQVSFTVNKLYPLRTLTDYQSGVTVSGNINAYSDLVVNKLTLHANCAACDVIRKALQNSAFRYIYGVEIRLTRGFIGDLSVSLPVGAQYEGETVTIACCSNGEYKTYTAKVQYGRAVFNVRSLSLFAAFVPASKLAPPQTGGADFPWTALGAALIALGAALPALIRRRRERN